MARPPVVDMSGVVWSEWRGKLKVPAREGWIKGFVFSDTGAIVAAHSNPKVGSEIYIEHGGYKHTRKITKVIKPVFPSRNPAYTFGGDIAVVTVDRPWPADSARYAIAPNIPDQWWCLNKKGELLFRTRGLDKDIFITGKNPAGDENEKDAEGLVPSDLRPGDSGLPWFSITSASGANSGVVAVAGFTSRGWHGEGPSTTHIRMVAGGGAGGAN